MMRVVVIRHHDVDSAGFIGEAFEARGAELDVHLVPDDGPLPSLDGVDHVVVLGAVNSVNDEGPASVWIAEELAWLRAADQAGVPVLGICFGAQALCAALGGRVEAMDRKEIGWVLVDPADPAVIPPGPWLEFHGDRCLLPAGATVLARNEVAVQAFRIGRHLAVQFHPEVDGPSSSAGWIRWGRGRPRRREPTPTSSWPTPSARRPAARARADRLVSAALDLEDTGRVRSR